MIDGLSNLPDDVICHILSFLPTQEASRTAVLSSRWKLLWTMVPDLDFEFPMRSSTDKRVRFIHSIYAALLQRTVEGIRKFSLSGELYCAPYHVSTWVRRRNKVMYVCNVARATLCIRRDRYTAGVSRIFTLLLNLKWLSLSSETIRYLSDGGVDNLSLPQFPHLAYLRVELSHNCSWDLLLSFLQSAEKLEVLVIEKYFKRNIVRGELGHSWSEPPNIPWCLSTSFKRFEFSGIQSLKADLGFMQYTIRSSSTFEKIKLLIPKSKTKSKSLIERILRIRRASSRAIRWEIQCEDDSPDEVLEG